MKFMIQPFLENERDDNGGLIEIDLNAAPSVGDEIVDWPHSRQ